MEATEYVLRSVCEVFAPKIASIKTVFTDEKLAVCQELSGAPQDGIRNIGQPKITNTVVIRKSLQVLKMAVTSPRAGGNTKKFGPKKAFLSVVPHPS